MTGWFYPVKSKGMCNYSNDRPQRILICTVRFILRDGGQWIAWEVSNVPTDHWTLSSPILMLEHCSLIGTLVCICMYAMKFVFITWLEVNKAKTSLGLRCGTDITKVPIRINETGSNSKRTWGQAAWPWSWSSRVGTHTKSLERGHGPQGR